MDILSDARRRIVRQRVATIERPPKDFSKPYNVAAGVAGAGALSALGAVIGSHAGIALFGTAISGAWILAPILGIAGLAFGTMSSSDKTDKN